MKHNSVFLFKFVVTLLVNTTLANNMTTKTIHIDESNKYAQAFLDYLKSLDFVKIEENEDVVIPQSQIKETRRRISLVNSGEINTRSWDKAKKEIFD